MLLTYSRFHDRSYPRHAHDGYSVSLVTEGVHRFVVETERLEAHAGEVRIIHPCELHETLPGSWSHINLSIETARIESTAQKMGIDAPVLFQRLIRDETLNELIRTLYTRRFEMRTDDDAAPEPLIARLLERHLFVGSARESDAPSQEMIRAREYLRAHACDSALSLDDAARAAGMSKYHFLRRFRETFGRTPHRYLQNLRIDCVRRLMRRGVSLAETAQACGFCDQSHMIRTYRKFYGHTPGSIPRRKAQ